MKKRPFLYIFVFLISYLVTGCANTNIPQPGSPNESDKELQDNVVPSCVTWLASHWNADAEIWIQMANLHSNGNIEWWLSESTQYGYQAKCWNHIDAAHYISPIKIPQEQGSLNDSDVRKKLSDSFATQLMDGLCQNNESWSFQITEYSITQVVTQEVSRDEQFEKIWTCYVLADFKFDGIISPIGHGNTGKFAGVESFGMYEMVLDNGTCIFYPIYSDNFQRITP